jgi:hypothetical protein
MTIHKAQIQLQVAELIMNHATISALRQEVLDSLKQLGGGILKHR